MNARTPEALRVLSEQRLPIFEKRNEALTQLLQKNAEATVRVSEKTRAFWEAKQRATENFLQVFRDAAKSEAELSSADKMRRQEYLAAANALWSGLKDVLLTLHVEIIGPYTLGSSHPPFVIHETRSVLVGI